MRRPKKTSASLASTQEEEVSKEQPKHRIESVYPTFGFRSFILCEDIRVEMSGKEILIGVYSGGLFSPSVPFLGSVAICVLPGWPGCFDVAVCRHRIGWRSNHNGRPVPASGWWTRLSAKVDGSSRRQARERRDAPAAELGLQDGTVPTCEGCRTYPSKARASSFRSV
jgi:hypothetical protein